MSTAEANTKEARKAAEKIARALTKKRTAAASPLTESISDTMQQLGMPSATVEVEIGKAELGPEGHDKVEFLFSANAGEELKSLSKVASGGELSRFMLALKQALADSGSVGTMIFDEIDTGISGKVARQVGSVMRGISGKQQVICITHLPQIASMSESMIKVAKSESGGKSTVTANAIDAQETVTEVARLISGAKITDAAMDGARELIAEGNNGHRD